MSVDCHRGREGRGRWCERSGRRGKKRKALVRGHDSRSYCSVSYLLGECFMVSESIAGVCSRPKEHHELVNYGSIDGAYEHSQVHSLLEF